MTDGAQLPAKERDKYVALLTPIANSLSSQVTGLLPSVENLIGISVATVVGAVTLGVTQRHPALVAALPFPLILLFSYLLQTNTEMLARAGHKRYVEELVNELAGRPVFIEESHVAPTLHGRLPIGRLSIVMLNLLLALALVTAIAVSATQAIRLQWWVETAYWLALGVSLGMLAAAIREQSRAYANGFRAARAGYSGAPPTSSSLLAPVPASDGE
jgi:hypothetical protein